MLSDIEQWLGKLSLEKYVVVFTEAEIDFATLPFLTDDDLKELGLPLGPRRKVSEAIKQLIGGLIYLPPIPLMSRLKIPTPWHLVRNYHLNRLLLQSAAI